MKRLQAMPQGAQLEPDGGVRFRLWAPSARSVDVELHDGPPRHLPMQPLPAGWYELVTGEARAGSLYRFRIDGRLSVPDPASRFQPDDIAGPSQVIDPGAFDWPDADWAGRRWEEAVIYELHVGSFTPEGTFRGVQGRLDYLRDLGVTAIELMPIADFPGTRNWGYDGVLPFAPDSRYGRPEDLKALVAAAHARGLMIFLDVVYNHVGPEGNYLHDYARPFFTDRHHTPWGQAINLDGPDSGPVRSFLIHNALYWLMEYGFDGLRLDAVHEIKDDSGTPLLTALAHEVRAAAGDRHVHLVLENDRNDAELLARDGGGRPLLYAAQWNDDFHHALHVAMTGEQEAHFLDYATGTVARVARCLTQGFDYQGEVSGYRDGTPRGKPSSHLPPTAFVNFLQNHDQIGNRAFGERLAQLVTPEALRLGLGILLLSPAVPMLFMGEEWAATQPYPFFCDFDGELGQAIRDGRQREFAATPRFDDPAMRERIPDPLAVATFQTAQLDWGAAARPEHREWHATTRSLLALRRTEIMPLLALGAIAARHEITGSAISVAWDFAGARLGLVANLAARPRAPAPSSEARATDGRRVIWRCGDITAGGLGAWSAQVTVEGLR